MRRSTPLLLALGALVCALGWATVWTARGGGAGSPRHLALYVGAGAAWAAALFALPRLRPARGQLAAVFAVAVLMRVPGWLAPPAHSDDIYRYVWDGRVQRAGINPYLYPPDARELAHLRDADFERLNNRGLPTIYPPAAELLFRLPRGVASFKLLVAVFDLGLLVLLARWLRRSGGDPRRALAWGWSPLAAVELAQEGHMDVLGIALLCGGLYAHAGGRRLVAGALLGLSAAVKLLAAAALPAFGRRAAVAFLVAAAVVALPYAAAGPRMTGSLGEYGRRWRANDGAFALLHAGATAWVARSRFRAEYHPAQPGLARLLSGRDRDAVYPDEVANFAARAVAFLLFAAAVATTLWARLGPRRVVEVALGAFLLMTPTLHPWYVLWVVPLLALGGHPAFVALAALVPLGYAPLPRFLEDGTWHDPIWARALVHGLPWALLLKDLLPKRRGLISSDP